MFLVLAAKIKVQLWKKKKKKLSSKSATQKMLFALNCNLYISMLFFIFNKRLTNYRLVLFEKLSNFQFSSSLVTLFWSTISNFLEVCLIRPLYNWRRYIGQAGDKPKYTYVSIRLPHAGQLNCIVWLFRKCCSVVSHLLLVIILMAFWIDLIK